MAPAKIEESSEEDRLYPTRIFGLGVGFGGGVGVVSVTATGESATGVAPLIYLPTLEAQIFIPDTDQFSVDISLPLTNIIVASAALSGLYLQLDAFFNFGIGEQNIRLVAGPGIGFDAVSYDASRTTSYSYGGIRFLGQIGFEALTNEQGFSFKLLARPYFEVYLGDLVANTSTVGGGGVVMLSFSGNVVN